MSQVILCLRKSKRTDRFVSFNVEKGLTHKDKVIYNNHISYESV